MLARLGACGCSCGYEGKPRVVRRRVRQIFRRSQRYCWGGTVPSQVVIAAMLTRTTASA
jgi:hypothetical protein